MTFNDKEGSDRHVKKRQVAHIRFLLLRDLLARLLIHCKEKCIVMTLKGCSLRYIDAKEGPRKEKNIRANI